MKPNFLLVGGSRCATDYISKVLGSHPDIFIHPKKEVHFFDRHFEEGFDWYFSHFEGRRERIVGEATPAYLYGTTPSGIPIADAIHAMNPDVKILISLRDPVERSVSHYHKLARDGGIAPSQLLIEGIKRAESRESRLISDSLYSEKVKSFIDLFPADAVKVILHDDIKTDPAKTFREIYGFLGVTADFRSPLLGARVNTSNLRGKRRRILNLVHKGLVKYKFGQLSKIFYGLFATKAFAIDKETRCYLMEKFSADIVRLESVIGKDLSAWKTAHSNRGDN